jgi:hypothetical protein
MTLGRHGEALALPRLEVLEKIQAESAKRS